MPTGTCAVFADLPSACEIRRDRPLRQYWVDRGGDRGQQAFPTTHCIFSGRFIWIILTPWRSRQRLSFGNGFTPLRGMSPTCVRFTSGVASSGVRARRSPASWEARSWARSFLLAVECAVQETRLSRLFNSRCIRSCALNAPRDGCRCWRADGFVINEWRPPPLAASRRCGRSWGSGRVLRRFRISSQRSCCVAWRCCRR